MCRRSRIFVWAAVALVVLGAIGPAWGQDSDGTVVSLSDPGPVPPEVAVLGFGVDQEASEGELAIVVRTVGSVFDLPSGGRISLFVGDPTGDAIRHSLVIDDTGVPVGLAEQRSSGVFSEIAAIPVTVTAEGDARIVIDDPEPTSFMWAEAAIPDGPALSTPPVASAGIVGFPGLDVLATAVFGAVTTLANIPTGGIVAVEGSADLRVSDGSVLVSSTTPAPTTVDGAEVTVIRDILRIGAELPADGRIVSTVVIDHGLGTVTAFDASTGFPAAVSDPSEYILSPYTVAVDGTFTVELSLDVLQDAFGTAATENPWIGITRIIDLDDERRVTAAGGLGQLNWFTAAAEVPVTSTTPPDTTESTLPQDEVSIITIRPTDVSVPSSDSSGGGSALVIAVAVLGALILGGAALYAARRSKFGSTSDEEALGAMASVVRDAQRDPPARTRPPTKPGEADVEDVPAPQSVSKQESRPRSDPAEKPLARRDADPTAAAKPTAPPRGDRPVGVAKSSGVTDQFREAVRKAGDGPDGAPKPSAEAAVRSMLPPATPPVPTPDSDTDESDERDPADRFLAEFVREIDSLPMPIDPDQEPRS